MDLLYNDADFQPPPLNTLPPIGKINVQDINKIKSSLQESIVFFQNQIDFNHAAALLSRLLARRKNSFKRFKGFKSCTKLNSALSCYLKINITMILENFLSSLPESNLYIDRLPVRPNYEYILLRLITIQKIHQRIKFCCEEAFKYFRALLQHNFFLDILTMFISNLSAIWSTSKSIHSFTINLYNNLIAHRNLFPLSSQENTRLDQFDFPEMLNPIVDENKHEEKDKKFNITFNTAQTIRNPVANRESESNGAVDVDHRFASALTARTVNLATVIDLGTSINRNDDDQLDLTEIKSSVEIRKFFDIEDKKRKENLKNTKTNQIKTQDWILIKKTIFNKINSNDSRTAMKLFRKLVVNKIK